MSECKWNVMESGSIQEIRENLMTLAEHLEARLSGMGYYANRVPVNRVIAASYYYDAEKSTWMLRDVRNIYDAFFSYYDWKDIDIEAIPSYLG